MTGPAATFAGSARQLFNHARTLRCTVAMFVLMSLIRGYVQPLVHHPSDTSMLAFLQVKIKLPVQCATGRATLAESWTLDKPHNANHDPCVGFMFVFNPFSNNAPFELKLVPLHVSHQCAAAYRAAADVYCGSPFSCTKPHQHRN